MKKGVKNKLMKLSNPLKQLRDADLIVAYINDPDNPDLKISAALKKKLDIYIFVESLKVKYQQHSYIVGQLKLFYHRNERQAYTDIRETEYIFSKVLKINYDIEQY